MSNEQLPESIQSILNANDPQELATAIAWEISCDMLFSENVLGHLPTLNAIKNSMQRLGLEEVSSLLMQRLDVGDFFVVNTSDAVLDSKKPTHKVNVYQAQGLLHLVYSGFTRSKDPILEVEKAT